MKNISDEQLRAYFLGKLPERETEILEMECAADARLTERAQTVESELADDFLRKNLSAADAALFEANYLTTETRRHKLRVASGLWQIAREETPKTAAAAPVAKSFWQKLFGRQKALKLAFGGLILLFVVGAIAFYLPNLSADRQLVSEVKPVNLPPVQTENPLIQNPAPETQTPDISATENTVVSANRETVRNENVPQKNPPAPKNASKNGIRNQSALAVFALLPGALRDSGEQFITVAPASKNLEIRLKLPEDAGNYQTYRAIIKTAEGDSIFISPTLKSSNFTIPAEKLENRTYIIFLEGKNAENEFESITEYTFRVRR